MPEAVLAHFPEQFRLTPEFRLLAACSWLAPPALEQEQADKIISLCKVGIDWDGFLALVRRHGVAGIVYSALRRHVGDSLPESVHEELKRRQIQVAGQSLRQMAELVRLAKLFDEQSIELIVMKGVLLSQQLYGNPALRESTDIDLMVSLEDFDRADVLIHAAGYRCYSPGETLTERQKKYYMATGQNYEYCHEDSGLKLELHWRSYLWTPAQAKVLWRRRQSITWMEESFNVWDDDALLISLCYHGAHHEWCSLKWLSDVAMLLAQKRPAGWAGLLELSEQLGMRRVLAQSALLVHWLYEIPLPGPLQVTVAGELSAVPLGRTAVRAILMSPEELAAAGKRLDTLRHSCYLLRLIPAPPYGEILRSIVITYPDFRKFPLPNSLFWLYIPLRPVFWFLRNYMSPRNNG